MIISEQAVSIREMTTLSLLYVMYKYIMLLKRIFSAHECTASHTSAFSNIEPCFAFHKKSTLPKFSLPFEKSKKTDVSNPFPFNTIIQQRIQFYMAFTTSQIANVAIE